MPMNTGNIGRSCVATNTRLHLIEPLGFKLNDKMVKRAGLDYWPHLDVTVYSDFKDFLEKNPGARPYMATTKTTQVYTDAASGQLLNGGAPSTLFHPPSTPPLCVPLPTFRSGEAASAIRKRLQKIYLI